MSGEVVLSLREVTFRRVGKEIVSGVDLEVRQGEHWALLGPNGAGKSTLLSLCGGWAHPRSGTVDVLDHRSTAPWTVLSQGERGRALIARALASDPRLLLLDEPTTGLDLAAREQLLGTLSGLERDTPGLATVLVTHHLEELPVSTTHALLLAGGSVVVAGPVGDVLTSQWISQAFGHPVEVARTSGRWHARAHDTGGVI